jgi:hypothetical protein
MQASRLLLALSFFLCFTINSYAFWGLFGGKKKKAPEDQRLEEMQERNFEFKTKGNFQYKILSPHDLSRKRNDGVNWNRKWGKKDSNYFNEKASRRYHYQADGMDTKVMGFDKRWSDDSRKAGSDFKKRFKDEESLTPWNERKMVPENNHRASKYERQLPIKEYRGKELAKIKRDMEEIGSVLGETKDLPDRPLTVAEVRDLLNRGRVNQATREDSNTTVKHALPAQ